MGRRGELGRQDQGAASGRHARSIRTPHGSDTRAGPAYRRDPRRAGLRPGGDRKAARRRRDMTSDAPRSYLYVPGNRPDRYDKACAAGADAVIIDLEDAVPPAEKPKARDALSSWLSPERSVIVRINAADTEWF